MKVKEDKAFALWRTWKTIVVLLDVLCQCSFEFLVVSIHIKDLFLRSSNSPQDIVHSISGSCKLWSSHICCCIYILLHSNAVCVWIHWWKIIKLTCCTCWKEWVVHSNCLLEDLTFSSCWSWDVEVLKWPLCFWTMWTKLCFWCYSQVWSFTL